MRQFHRCRQLFHLARQQAEADVSGCFFTGGKERLKTHADAQNRHAFFVRFTQRGEELRAVQAGNRRRKVADAGENDPLRVAQMLRRGGAMGFRAERLQRAFNRGKISRAVVDHGDVHSIPLVEGSRRWSWRSRVMAKRNARAKALKIDSTWW